VDREPVISVRDLTAGYPGRPVLEHISVDVMPGRITCIVGPSGCGKSTLLKCIVGLLRPLSGSVFLLGQDLTTMDEQQVQSALSRVGLLFQQGAMLNSITVAENVALPLREHTSLPASVMAEMVRLKLELVGLAHAADLLPSELSGGMRKRAALARAMTLDPEVLLCDEPSAGLDPQTAAGLDMLILRLRETFGMTVVVVTHELPSIHKIADDVIMLGRDGRLRFAGTLADATRSDDPEVLDFFARREPEVPLGTSSLLDILQGVNT